MRIGFHPAHPFLEDIVNTINDNPETGATYFENKEGELLIFTTQNGDDQFGLPYLLAGRADLPFRDAYGLDRRDDLVFVANGLGRRANFRYFKYQRAL